MTLPRRRPPLIILLAGAQLVLTSFTLGLLVGRQGW